MTPAERRQADVIALSKANGGVASAVASAAPDATSEPHQAAHSEGHLRRIVYSIGGTGLVQISNFASGIALARLLGPEHRGELSQIIAWYGFLAPVLLLGLNDSVVYFRSRGDVRADVLGTAFTGCAVTILLALGACGTAFALNLQHLPPDARPAAFVFLAFVPIFHLSQVIMGYFQASSQTKVWMLLRTVGGPSYVVFIILAFLVHSANVLGMVFANLASQLVPVIIGLIAITLERPKLRLPSWAELHRFFAYGSILTMQRISVVSRDNLDRMVLPFFITATSFGNYVVSATTAYFVFIVGVSVDLVSFPAVARQTDPQKKIRMAETFIAGTVLLTTVAVIGLLIVSPMLITIMFGEAYRAAVPLVVYFLIAGGLQAIRTVVGGVFKAFARGGSLAWIEAVNSILMFVVLFGLARREGAMAGALSHLISASLSCALAFVLAVLNLGLSPTRLILPLGLIDQGRAVFRRSMRAR